MEVRVYDTADGLKSAEHELAYIQPAAGRATDGRLWFATTKGVVSLDPARHTANPWPPGSYRFHVTSCNNDGVWSEEGAAIDFTLAPHFYQTRAFLALLVALVLLGLWGLYRLRVARMEAQFATVMKERNRMAREIHDTLAQGLVTIGMHLDGMRHDPSPENVDHQVEKARGLVKTRLAEARRSIWDLQPQFLEDGDLAWACPTWSRRWSPAPRCRSA